MVCVPAGKQIEVVAYVIMPNHVHVLLYFPQPGYTLNNLISNAKRFLAYEIIKRLKAVNDSATLMLLQKDLTQREQRKEQVHKVFEESFDAKPVYTRAFFNQKLDYIHYNPVRGKWQLVADYTTYVHSNAGFYETGMCKLFQPFDYRVLEGAPLTGQPTLKAQSGSPYATGLGSEDPA